MKLRNKKTGEVRDFIINKDKIQTSSAIDCWAYNSLAELNEDWEDYEEPIGWCVTMYGGISRINEDDKFLISDLKEIGNLFDDKESAYDALEKLKAWKRLKYKGIEFYGWRKNPTGSYDFLARWGGIPPKMHDIINDLDLLFGGEE